MTPERLSLADVDGTLCVRDETTDYNEPTIVALHWPTTVQTRDALRYFEIDDVAKLSCSRTRPGEYFVGIKNPPSFGAIWRSGTHVSLVDGGATQSVKTDKRPAPQPKTRKGTLIYWSGGCWVKHTSKGSEKINPLNV